MASWGGKGEAFPPGHDGAWDRANWLINQVIRLISQAAAFFCNLSVSPRPHLSCRTHRFPISNLFSLSRFQAVPRPEGKGRSWGAAAPRTPGAGSREPGCWQQDPCPWGLLISAASEGHWPPDGPIGPAQSFHATQGSSHLKTCARALQAALPSPRSTENVTSV